MRTEATTEKPFATDADTIALGIFADETADRPELQSLLDSGEAKSTFRHLAVIHVDGRRLIVAGLGRRSQFDAERARVIAALVGRRARELATRALCWTLPAPESEIAEGLVQGTVLGAYRFDRYKPNSTDEPFDRLIVAADDDVADPVCRAALIAAAQNRARELVDMPANELTPAALAEYARGVADRHDAVAFTSLDGDEIRELGMGAFAAVAQGSDQDPRLIALRYEPLRPADPERRLALIGKGITFDTGGLWLKQKTSMIDMKGDMAGGAAVIEAIGTLAELQAPIRVLGVVGAAENMISGRAVRSGDIITALDGTTIEVVNPDAEGRLVLADCITWARHEGCDAIIDIATLTAGPTMVLGSVFAAVLANDDALAELVVSSGQRTGERVWRLPLDPAYAEMVKGRYAQLANRSERREALTNTAAELLHHFVGDVPWAHLDIAGVSDDMPVPYLGKGGSGYGVRLLTEVALSF